MRLRKLSNLLIIGLLIIGMTSCVYLRLLDFKNQLVDFDTNFSTEVDETFTLHFKNPMLYKKDVVYLSEVDPSLVIPNSTGVMWSFRFHRIDENYQRTDNGPDLIFDMGFNHDDKLNKIVLSEIFLHMIPPNFLEQTIRALGNADIDRKNRHVKAKLGDIDKDSLNLPHKDHIIKELGEPMKVEPAENNEELLSYNYFISGVEVKDQEKGSAEARLYIDKSTGTLMQVRCKFAGLKLSVDYRKWLNDQKQVASS